MVLVALSRRLGLPREYGARHRLKPRKKAWYQSLDWYQACARRDATRGLAYDQDGVRVPVPVEESNVSVSVAPLVLALVKSTL